jgi:hypothetical protein
MYHVSFDKKVEWMEIIVQKFVTLTPWSSQPPLEGESLSISSKVYSFF